MSEELAWQKYEGDWIPGVYGFPYKHEEYTADKRVFIKMIDGKWHMDAGFDSRVWNWEPMEGVTTLEQAKAVAVAVWRMR